MPSKLDKIHEDARRKAMGSWSIREDFLDTDCLRNVHYGNLVLRRQAHLFLSHGVLTAMVLLSFVWLLSANWQSITAVFGFFQKDDKPLTESYEFVTCVTQLPPPPPIAAPPPAVAKAAPAPANVGKIKKVKADEVPLQQTFATQKEISHAIQSQPADGADCGSASGSDEGATFVAREKDPVLLSMKKSYPEMARTAGIEGRVFISVLVGEDGRAVQAKILKRIPADCNVFDAAAMKAVMEAKYAPGIQNGNPIKVWFTVPIRFQLD
ncbi:energy transducer TonB [Chlorobium phaeobacteroides]|nr:energy transducer TonB [Chlorobium phaeobacteroides]MBV5326282.1 energy transducer TonB [Chlorobium sp.]